MKLTKQMLDEIERRAKKALIEKFHWEFSVKINRRENKPLSIIISSISLETYIFTEAILIYQRNLVIKTIIESTGLNWKYKIEHIEGYTQQVIEYETIVFDSGYVVFYDTEDDRIEEYLMIDGDECHSPLLFVDGKLNQDADWENDISVFEFARELPKEKICK